MYRQIILEDLNALSISFMCKCHQGSFVEENKDYVVFKWNTYGSAGDGEGGVTPPAPPPAPFL